MATELPENVADVTCTQAFRLKTNMYPCPASRYPSVSPSRSQAPSRPQQRSMIEKQLSNIEKRLRPESPAWSLRLQDSLAKTIRRNVLQKAG